MGSLVPHLLHLPLLGMERRTPGAATTSNTLVVVDETEKDGSTGSNLKEGYSVQPRAVKALEMSCPSNIVVDQAAIRYASRYEI